MMDLRQGARGQAGAGWATILFLWGIAWAAWLPCTAQQPGADNEAATLRTLEAQRFAAQSRHDNRELELILDSDLVWIESGKLLTKGEYLSQLKLSAAQPAVAMEAMTVRRYGDAAIVIGSYREKHAPGAKASAERWRFEDTWVYKAPRWVLVSAAASPEAK
jgi:hypothetical protein